MKEISVDNGECNVCGSRGIVAQFVTSDPGVHAEICRECAQAVESVIADRARIKEECEQMKIRPHLQVVKRGDR